MEGPILLGCKAPDSPAEQKQSNQDWRNLTRHADEDQVQLDVDRAFVYYPKGMADPFSDPQYHRSECN